MIPTLIVLLLLGGNFGANHLDLSDPAVLAEFRQNVLRIIPDPVRAANVSRAVYDLNVASYHGRSSEGVIEQEFRNLRSVASSYNSSNEDVHIALRKLEHSLSNVSRGTIQGREIIRQNTTKKEWEKLLKELSD